MGWLKRLFGGESTENAEESDSGRQGMVTVINRWGIGDGKPFVLPTDPDIPSVFAQATERERSALPYGYLSHPSVSVRLATIAQLAAWGTYHLQKQSLVDLLADSSHDVRLAAARALWVEPEAVENALRCLRDEIHGSGFRSTVSPKAARQDLEILRDAAPSDEDRTRFKALVSEIVG